MSINQLNELTGIDRRTIKERLVGLPFQLGTKKAMCYQVRDALAAIYKSPAATGQAALEAARIENLTQDSLLKMVNREEKEKTRIPISVVQSVNGAALQEIAAKIKLSGLPESAVNAIFAQLREIPKALKWED